MQIAKKVFVHSDRILAQNRAPSVAGTDNVRPGDSVSPPGKGLDGVSTDFLSIAGPWRPGRWGPR